MIDLDLSDLGLDDFAPRKPEKIAKPDWYFDAKPHFQAIVDCAIELYKQNEDFLLNLPSDYQITKVSEWKIFEANACVNAGQKDTYLKNKKRDVMKGNISDFITELNQRLEVIKDYREVKSKTRTAKDKDQSLAELREALRQQMEYNFREYAEQVFDAEYAKHLEANKAPQTRLYEENKELKIAKLKLTDALENLQKQFRAAIRENEKLKQELKELKRQKFTSLDGGKSNG